MLIQTHVQDSRNKRHPYAEKDMTKSPAIDSSVMKREERA